MDPARERTISKFMSLVLRHKPSELGISLDAAGWTDFDSLAAALETRFGIGRDDVLGIVKRDAKGRYVIDGNRIRAAQGHSVGVDIGLAPAVPPDILFHGTTRAVLATILAQGLDRRQRSHVHLSADVGTALTVGGRRRGETVVLAVDAARMHRDGHPFYRADNGVWLAEAVAPCYLRVVEP